MTDHLLDEEFGNNPPPRPPTIRPSAEAPPAPKPDSFADRLRCLFGRNDRIVCSAQEEFLKRKIRCEERQEIDDHDSASAVEEVDCDNEFKMCSFEIDNGPPEPVNSHHM